MYQIFIVTNKPLDIEKYELTDVSSKFSSRFGYLTKVADGRNTASALMRLYEEGDIHSAEILSVDNSVV
jgi:hypothetical protein